MKKQQTIFGLLSFSLLLVQLLPGISVAQSQNNSRSQAQVTVRAALKAMGGEDKIRAVKSIRFEGIGHIFSIEQSERPEGPWIVNYLQITKSRDLVICK